MIKNKNRINSYYSRYHSKQLHMLYHLIFIKQMSHLSLVNEELIRYLSCYL